MAGPMSKPSSSTSLISSSVWCSRSLAFCSMKTDWSNSFLASSSARQASLYRPSFSNVSALDTIISAEAMSIAIRLGALDGAPAGFDLALQCGHHRRLGGVLHVLGRR